MPVVLTEKRHPDLSSIHGTFAQVIEENTNTLTDLINDDDISCEELKEFVFEMMENCKQTAWIRKAKVKMERMYDKNELAFFIYNSMLSGANLGVA